MMITISAFIGSFLITFMVFGIWLHALTFMVFTTGD